MAYTRPFSFPIDDGPAGGFVPPIMGGVGCPGIAFEHPDEGSVARDRDATASACIQGHGRVSVGGVHGS
jgi:hypothetical protein